ncbi:MAG: hypothetical protein ACYDA0_06695 [Candidatus Dormibacteraceae bacterium]
MSRLIVWTICVVIAAAVAVFDLITAWALHIEWLDLALLVGLFGIAAGLFVALVIAGSGERRRIRTHAHTSLDVVRPAARGARWSALARHRNPRPPTLPAPHARLTRWSRTTQAFDGMARGGCQGMGVGPGTGAIGARSGPVERELPSRP